MYDHAFSELPNHTTQITSKSDHTESGMSACLLQIMYGHFILPQGFVHVGPMSDGWMDERCFRPLLCTVKAELGRGQPGLMR